MSEKETDAAEVIENDEDKISRISIDIDTMFMQMALKHQTHPINLFGIILARMSIAAGNLGAYDIFMHLMAVIKDRIMEEKIDALESLKKQKDSVH